MRLILEFLKPHWRLCAVTMALSLLDVGGALLIPTLVGDLINGATGGAIGFDGLLRTGVRMVVVATVSGIAAIAGGWVCAVLTARVGRDLREAVYRKSLTLSVSDFRAFGVSSFTTRTTSDVSNIRFALLNFFQLVVPVPVVFAFALALAFGKDWVLGALLAAVLAVICALSVPIVRQAAGIFRLLQKQLDRIATVLLENITGVRVVRAFDKSAHEEARMEATFEDYRATGVQTVRLFAFMDGYLFSAINLFILAVLAVSGFRIEAGRFAPGDITAVIEYAWLALVYLQLALTVALTLPRAFECLDRIRAVFDHPPQIRDAPDCGPIPRSPEVLALHGVSFRYPDAEEPTLVGLDFVCRHGAPHRPGRRALHRPRGHPGLQPPALQRAQDRPRHRPPGAEGAYDGLPHEQRHALHPPPLTPGAGRPPAHRLLVAAQGPHDDRRHPRLLPIHQHLRRPARPSLLPPQRHAVRPRLRRAHLRLPRRRRGTHRRQRPAPPGPPRGSVIRDADLILYMERGDITEKGTHEELLRKGGAYAALYASQFA